MIYPFVWVFLALFTGACIELATRSDAERSNMVGAGFSVLLLAIVTAFFGPPWVR